MMGWAVISVLFLNFFAPNNAAKTSVEIITELGPATYSVEVADRPWKQIQGLMHRDSIGDVDGMIFTYPEDRIVQFWMKNVSFPLDMLFLDRCGKIVKIHANAQAGNESIVSYHVPVRAVLELRGGTSKSAQIRIGNLVRIANELAVFDACS